MKRGVIKKMTTKKATRRALFTSIMALVMCLVMLVGTTFAWFTDSVTSGVNTIKSGNLDVELEYKNSATNDFTKVTPETKVFMDGALWEPGHVEYAVLKVSNVGSLALKYALGINVASETGSVNVAGEPFNLSDHLQFAVLENDQSGLGRDAMVTAAETAEHKALSAGYQATGSLLAGAEAAVVTLVVWMPTTVGNEANYAKDAAQPAIDLGISLTATQEQHEKDSFGDDYDAAAGEGTAFYSLAAFNALTEIPADVKNVYVTLGSVSLKDGSVVIGNDDLRDKYERNITADEPYGISYTDKDGINLFIVGGTIKDGPAVDNSVSNKIAFRIPDKSTVTFQNVKIEGFFGLSGATADNPYGSVMPHKIAGVTFDGCTFDALWFQNGGFGTSQITIKNSTFNKFENSVYASNTNPMWFKNIGQTGTNISIDNCVFNTNRPVKVVEETVSGQTVSITNCTFNMEENDSEYKNAAIMFSTINGTLGNVVVSGNKVNGGVALLTFYNPPQITMAEGATFTVSDNTLGTGVKTSVVWKSNTEFTPDFVR